MPAKAATANKPAAPKKASSEPAHPTYRDMIIDAISTLKERNGSSRQAIKKYIQSNFKDLKNFDSQFNLALRRGVEKGYFIQPKGASGTVKLNMKKSQEQAKEKKPAAKKDDAAKKATTKKPAAKKDDAEKKPKKATGEKKATTKKTTAKKDDTEKKPKATSKPKTKKASTKTAPAVTEKPAVLTKTKSGRVSKGTAAPKSAPKKKTAAAPKKKSTPKKAAAAPAPAAAESS